MGTKKTSYEIWNEKKPKVKYFQCLVASALFSMIEKNLGKFDAKSDEGIFFGYSVNSQAYRVFNKRTKMVMESINAVIDDAIPTMIVDESGDVTNLKKNNDDENSSQDSDVEKKNHRKRNLLLIH